MIRLQNVLKMFLRRICETSWRCLENVLKTLWQDVMKTSWRRLEDVWTRIYWSWPTRLEDVLKTSSEEVWLIRIYSSSSRRIEDVFRRPRRKTSLRRLHQDECLLGVNTITLNKNTNTVILLEKITVEKSSLKKNKRRTR